MQKLRKILKKQGFTLVELIIVIAIIAVLAVAAFMMLTKWLGQSRDSRKLADIETLSKSLMVWLNDLENDSGKVPIPDNNGEILFDGVHVWNQGYFGVGVASTLDSIQKAPTNPLGNYYTYSRTIDGKKYQIVTEMENGTVVSSIASMVSAGERVNATRGNFDPGIYLFQTGSTYKAIYLPSIVGAGVEDGEDMKISQKFVIDGNGSNLVESNENIKTYVEAVETVNKPLDTVWSGEDLTELQEESVIDDIATELGGMVIGSPTITTTQVSGLLSAGGVTVTVPTQPEPVTCEENYVNDGNDNCVLDSCSGNKPTNNVILGTQGTGTWGYLEALGVCKFKCELGYTYNSGTNTCEVSTYTVTFDVNGGSGGTTNVTATYGAVMPTLVTAPTRNGYLFNGYYSATSGGTKYYNADKSSATTYNLTSATTLYAQWIAPKKTCLEYKTAGYNTSKVYTIDPDGTGSIPPYNVYCDMTTDGGGWTMVFKQTNFTSSNILHNNAMRGNLLLLSESFNGTTNGSIIGDFNYTEMFYKNSSSTRFSIVSTLNDFSLYSTSYYCRDLGLVADKTSSGINFSTYKHIAFRLDNNEKLSAFMIGDWTMNYPAGTQCGQTWCAASTKRHGRYNGSCQNNSAGYGNWMIFVR